MDIVSKGLSAWLLTQGVMVKQAWLDTAIAATHQMSLVTAREPVYQKLLHEDFNDISLGRLPANIATMHKKQISGPVMVQVEMIRDVGDSLNHQLERLEGKDNDIPPEENEGDEAGDLFAAAAQVASVNKKGKTGGGVRGHGRQWGAPSRLLRVELTDGVTKVVGIEYKRIDTFNGLCAGVKLVLKQVDVLRGKLLLRPENITLVGGSVAAYADRNDSIRVLRKALKLDENSPPAKDIRGDVPPQSSSARAPSAQTVNDIIGDEIDDDILAQLAQEPLPSDLDDNDFQEQQPSRPAQYAAPIVRKDTAINDEIDFSTNDVHDDMFMDVLEVVARAETSNVVKHTAPNPEQSNDVKRVRPTVEPVQTQPRAVTRLADLQLPDPALVRIKVSVETLLGKLEYESGSFELHVAVTDGYQRAEFIFGDRYLSNLLRLTAAEFAKLSRSDRAQTRDRLLKPALKATPMIMTLDVTCANRRQLPAIVDMTDDLLVL